MHKFLIFTIGAGLTLACCGCNTQEQKEFHEEFVRSAHVEIFMPELGPYFVPLVVGSAAPLGGPSVLNAVCMDRFLLDKVWELDPGSDFVPSIFYVPDPNRAMKIKFDGRTIKGIETNPKFEIPQPK